ncbi:MAG: hypothetical protein JWQ16_3048 [Novosphingobium sp.]|nr:hypothetical protein [Novosphingobium sp.]
MSDAFEIQQTISLYSEASSRKDIATVVSTFAEDGLWELPEFGLKFRGHAQLFAALPGLTEPYECFQQFNAPAVITIDGDKATARSLMREYAKFRDKDVANEIMGFYNDELVRGLQGWKFQRRVYALSGGHSYDVKPIAFAIPDQQ